MTYVYIILGVLIIFGYFVSKKPHLVKKWFGKQVEEKTFIEDNNYVFKPIETVRTFNFSIEISEAGGGKAKMSIKPIKVIE